MKRNSILFAIIGGASFCLAAEPSRISPAAPEDFSHSETMTLEQGVLVMNSGNHVTKQTIAVDRTRPGRLTFEYKLAPGAKPQTFVIAVHSVTAEGKYLVGGRIFAVAGTETELVAPVRKGDRILKLKDASRWQKLPLKLGIMVAFNAKPEGADLPNFEISPLIAAVSAEGEVTLRSGISREYPAGTMIRAHRDIGSFGIGSAYRRAGEEWKRETIEIHPWDPRLQCSWWPGVARAGIYLGFLNGKVPEGSGVMFRNIVLEQPEFTMTAL